MTDAPPRHLQLTQADYSAYAAICATVIVHTETITLVFPARLETREVDGREIRTVVLDDPQTHDYEMIRGQYEGKIPASEQAARAALAEEIVASIGKALAPTTPRVPRPWEAFETQQPTGGTHGEG